MAMFEAQGPSGERLKIDAPDEASAQAAIAEMGHAESQGGGLFDDLPEYGEGSAMPAMPDDGMFSDVGISRRDQFATAFDPSADSPATAQGLGDKLDENGALQTAANSMMMGYGDEIMGTLAGGLTWAQGRGFDEGYDRMTTKIRGDIDRYAERHPVKAAMADVAGAIPTAMIPGGAAVRGAGLATKVARGAIAGASYGAARGYGEGEGGVGERADAAAHGAALGGLVGGAVPVAGRAVGKAAGKVIGRRKVPSVNQLDEAATALYKRADDAGVAIQPKALARGATIIPQRLERQGFDPELHKNTARALTRIHRMTESRGQLSLGEVENTRRVIRQAISASSGPEKKADQAMAMKALDEFDDWMNALKPRDMVSGRVSGKEAIGIVNEARSLWSRKSKGDMLADLVERARLDENTTGFEKALRREFRTLARNSKKMKRFSQDEQRAIRDVAKGGSMQWVLNAIGSFAPGLNVSGAARGFIGGVAGHAALGWPGAAAVPIAAGAARKGSEALTRRAARNADAVVRSGGQIPIDRQAARAAEGYANQLIGTGGQATAPLALPTR